MAGNGTTERRATRLGATVTLLKRLLLISLALNLLLGGLLVRGLIVRSTVRAVFVDGKLVCLVASEKAAKEVHRQVLAAKKGGFQGEASFRQKWEDKPWPGKGEKVHTIDEAVQLLKPKLDVVVEGWAIQVRGRTVVVLSTEQKARDALEAVKAKFLAEGETALEPQKFEVEPVVVRQQVPPDDLLDDVRTAAGELLRGAGQPQQYVVKVGDTPFSVAESHGMSLAKLYQLNPGLRQKAARNAIQPGETWTVAGPRPTVVVITKKETTRIAEVPFKTVEEPRSTLPAGERRILRAGQKGEAREWVRGTFRNEKLVPESRQVTRQEITRQPIAEVVAVGTAPPAAP
jgi:LysM repeat protein